MKRVLVEIRNLVRHRFNLDDDKADESQIVTSIRNNIHFRGANLWTLIFAILIASIGLNVNSTAVIIGAMLISPLMGPIMGVGLGIGINDLELVRNSLKNLFIAAFFSIITSTIYFWLTPLHEAQSEILARTTPSVWDVFIAFFGGLAGIVAGTRKEKSNVIPGVAIATALMPPLCTAGYGLANGKIFYFLGAGYLFFINCVFICISTFLIVRFLNFKRKEFTEKSIEKRVSRTILIIVIITTLPSVYLAYRIVQRSIFETNARKFVSSEFRFKRTQVVNQTFDIVDGQRMIDLLLIGEELTQPTIDTMKKRMISYNLGNTELLVRQGLNAREEIDFSEIRASILKDVFVQTDSLNKLEELEEQQKLQDIPDIKTELAALYPDITNYSLSTTTINHIDTTQNDTVTLAVFKFKNRKSRSEADKLREWLESRIHRDSVKLIIE